MCEIIIKIEIVCNPVDKPTILHVGTFKDDNIIFTEDIGVSKPQKHSFDNLDDLFNYVENEGWRRIQGVIIFKGMQAVKIYNSKYNKYKLTRGNEQSIPYRYLQVRMDRDVRRQLYDLYPSFGSTFDQYEDILYIIAKSIYSSYVRRFIKGEYTTVPKDEYFIIKVCQEWHKED